jgi:ribosomal protein S18 acetylase RimI-like enzyme
MMDSLHYAVPTSRYDFNELADIYNRAREDYIVPMPMNAKRMQEYVSSYDISLDSSFVAIAKDDEDVDGICMLGVRDNRTWITRLGVIPSRRRRRSGEFLMRAEMDESRRLGKKLMQLEVIKGNDPAHRLFQKLGFEPTRELLVIRRPPSPLAKELIPKMEIEPIPNEMVFDVLAEREDGAAWTEETASLRNAGNMKGLRVRLESGESGWIVFQRSPFQLSHFVLANQCSEEMMDALVAAVHSQHPLQDTKLENLASLHPTWPVFKRYGYMIAFERIEMVVEL